MAIWLVKKGSDNGKELFDDVDLAIVEAVSAAAAKTAAAALNPVAGSDYWTNATATDIGTGGAYTGGLGKLFSG